MSYPNDKLQCQAHCGACPLGTKWKDESAHICSKHDGVMPPDPVCALERAQDDRPFGVAAHLQLRQMRQAGHSPRSHSRQLCQLLREVALFARAAVEIWRCAKDAHAAAQRPPVPRGFTTCVEQQTADGLAGACSQLDWCIPAIPMTSSVDNSASCSWRKCGCVHSQEFAQGGHAQTLSWA